jgi:hypothetical protein
LTTTIIKVEKSGANFGSWLADENAENDFCGELVTFKLVVAYRPLPPFFLAASVYDLSLLFRNQQMSAW